MYVLPVVYRKSVMLTRIGGCDWVAFIPRNLQLIAYFFFFNKKTEYELRISDWSSDVGSSDLDEPHQDPIRELRDFNREPVWLALGIGAIGFAGMFCVFSYLAPTMTQVTGLPESWIPFGLVAFGVGSIIGTLGGG